MLINIQSLLSVFMQDVYQTIFSSHHHYQLMEIKSVKLTHGQWWSNRSVKKKAVNYLTISMLYLKINILAKKLPLLPALFSSSNCWVGHFSRVLHFPDTSPFSSSSPSSVLSLLSWSLSSVPPLSKSTLTYTIVTHTTVWSPRWSKYLASKTEL